MKPAPSEHLKNRVQYDSTTGKNVIRPPNDDVTLVPARDTTGKSQWPRGHKPRASRKKVIPTDPPTGRASQASTNTKKDPSDNDPVMTRHQRLSQKNPAPLQQLSSERGKPKVTEQKKPAAKNSEPPKKRGRHSRAPSPAPIALGTTPVPAPTLTDLGP